MQFMYGKRNSAALVIIIAELFSESVYELHFLWNGHRNVK